MSNSTWRSEALRRNLTAVVPAHDTHLDKRGHIISVEAGLIYMGDDSGQWAASWGDVEPLHVTASNWFYEE